MADAGQPFPATEEHLANERLAFGLGPGGDERDLARLAFERVNGLDEHRDGDGELLGRGRHTREPHAELLDPARRRDVARLEEEGLLAREVRVDGADRQATLADDIGNRRSAIALLAEHGDGRFDDPSADLMLVCCRDSWHGWKTPRRTCALFTVSHASRLRKRFGVDKTNGHSLSSPDTERWSRGYRCSADGERSSTASADRSQSSPSSSHSRH